MYYLIKDLFFGDDELMHKFCVRRNVKVAYNKNEETGKHWFEVSREDGPSVERRFDDEAFQVRDEKHSMPGFPDALVLDRDGCIKAVFSELDKMADELDALEAEQAQKVVL